MSPRRRTGTPSASRDVLISSWIGDSPRASRPAENTRRLVETKLRNAPQAARIDATKIDFSLCNRRRGARWKGGEKESTVELFRALSLPALLAHDYPYFRFSHMRKICCAGCYYVWECRSIGNMANYFNLFLKNKVRLWLNSELKSAIFQ